VDTEGRITSRLEESGLLSMIKIALLKEVVKPSIKIGGVEKTVYDEGPIQWGILVLHVSIFVESRVHAYCTSDCEGCGL
jgi:hypothetical protein